jgi:putative tryptophan/tyrosine transport system substrate-binding protein
MIGRALALLIALTPCLAAAQQPGKVYRVASVGNGPASCTFAPSELAKGTPWEGQSLARFEVNLRLALRDVALVDGRDVVFERRCFQVDEQLAAIAVELETRSLDAAFAVGPVVARVLKDRLRVPIVFVGPSDPVKEGLVDSIARPGGHVTGVSSQVTELAEKRWQTLREMLPQARTAAVMYERDAEALHFPLGPAVLEKFGFALQRLPVEGVDDIAAILAVMRTRRPDLLSVSVASWLGNHDARVFREATAAGIPTTCTFIGQVERGCLISYSVNYGEMVGQAGRMLGKILRGANPAEMPVEHGTTFELWVNLKTAGALGLTIPPSLLARANRVVE